MLCEISTVSRRVLIFPESKFEGFIIPTVWSANSNYYFIFALLCFTMCFLRKEHNFSFEGRFLVRGGRGRAPWDSCCLRCYFVYHPLLEGANTKNIAVPKPILGASPSTASICSFHINDLLCQENAARWFLYFSILMIYYESITNNILTKKLFVSQSSNIKGLSLFVF